ncbi:hypothetical protein HY498_02155 [Candidatus Woesearchaeota archaeon]|nr:hypothetical protein [Candidatus Woesearchaeota archaeon]
MAIRPLSYETVENNTKRQIQIDQIVANRSPNSYEGAIRDITKRQIQIDQIVANRLPSYVLSVEYATPKILEKLAKYGYIPPSRAFAATVPVDPNYTGDDIRPAQLESIRKGCKSKVFIYPEAFTDYYEIDPELNRKFPKPELYEDLESIITNVIFNNEFTDAKHLSEGIQDYPLSSFTDSNGKVNYGLYNQVLDILSNSAEYNGLVKNPRTKNRTFIQIYAKGLQKLTLRMYKRLFNPQLSKNMNPDFMQKLKRDFHPQKVFTD